MSICTVCNLCESPDSFTSASEQRKVPCNVKVFAEEHFTVWRCSHCHSLHCLEDADLPRFYAQYPFKDHTLNFHMRQAYHQRLKQLRKLGVENKNSFLDFGCGAGTYLEYLNHQGFEDVHGYDMFVPKYASSETLQRTYDVVVSHDVIEHTEEPKEFLKQMCSLVKPGGLLVIGTPNADEVSLRYKEIASPEIHVPYHRHILSEGCLKELAEAQGFALQAVSNRFYFDTQIPTVNTRFMWKYIEKKGGFIDAAVAPPDTAFILKSPELMFAAFFGYWFRMPGNMLLSFVKN